MKKPKLKRDWEGLTVRTLVPLSNGWGTIPAGTLAKVTRSWNGLSLRSEPCKCCGVRMSISRVPLEDVEIVDE